MRLLSPVISVKVTSKGGSKSVTLGGSFELDVIEYLLDTGRTDGLPCVPPTRKRVVEMLIKGMATDRHPHQVLGKCPPRYHPVTVESVAIAAVMAGCAPIHLEVVLSAVEAMLSGKFNLHGVHATTMGGCPVVIVNGPVRKTAALNSTTGALGSGSRANATIGRAIKLVLQNVGGGKLGGTESTTLGSPTKFTLAIAEREEILGGKWKPYHVGRGFDAKDSAATVIAVTGGPYQLVDKSTTDAPTLIRSMAKIIKVMYESRIPLLNDVLCVISPEHYKLLSGDGINTKEEFQKRLFQETARLMIPDIPFILSSLLYPRLVKKVRKRADFVAKAISMGFPVARLALLGLGSYLLGKMVFVEGSARQQGAEIGMQYIQTGISAMRSRPMLSGVSMLLLAMGLSSGKAWVRGLGWVVRGTCEVLSALGFSPTIVPKVENWSSFHVVVAGGDAGKFSAFFPSFGVGRDGPLAHMTRPTSKRIHSTESPLTGSLALDEFKYSEEEWEAILDPCGPQGDELHGDRDGKSGSKPKKLQFDLAKRLGTIQDTVAILDISKGNGDLLLDRLEHKLTKAYQHVKVIRFQKPTFSRPCPPELMQQIIDSKAKHVIVGLAD